MKKEWYQSKGKWGGLLVVVGGLIVTVGKFMLGETDVSSLIEAGQAVIVFGGGLGIWGVRDAQK